MGEGMLRLAQAHYTCGLVSNYKGLLSVEPNFDVSFVYQLDGEWMLGYVQVQSHATQTYIYHLTDIVEKDIVNLLDGKIDVKDIFNSNEQVIKLEIEQGELVGHEVTNGEIIPEGLHITSDQLPNLQDLHEVYQYFTAQ